MASGSESGCRLRSKERVPSATAEGVALLSRQLMVRFCWRAISHSENPCLYFYSSMFLCNLENVVNLHSVTK